MAYWNKDSGQYEGIGEGLEFSRYAFDFFDPSVFADVSASVNQLLREQPIGFVRSMDFGIGLRNQQQFLFSYLIGKEDESEAGDYSAIVSEWDSEGVPTTAFGFPYDAKFHATSSNLIQMSDFINQPFLLEKIVLEVSCAMKLNETLNGPNRFTVQNPAGTNPYLSSISMSTFFIMNQRRPVNFNIEQIIEFKSESQVVGEGREELESSFAFTSSVPTTLNGQFIDTGRDLITYVQIVGLSPSGSGGTNFFVTASGNPDLQRLYDSHEIFVFQEETPTPSGGSGVNWQGKFVVEGECKSLLKTEKFDSVQIGATGVNDRLLSGDLADGVVPGGYYTFRNKVDSEGRNGYRVANGRNFLNPSGEQSKTDEDVIFGLPFSFSPIRRHDKHVKSNPYLLLPGDELVFGWQVPLGPGFDKIMPNDIPANFTGSFDVYEGLGPELIFPVHPSKITFYGSILREGKEHHDTLNQLLTSETIHEVIE